MSHKADENLAGGGLCGPVGRHLTSNTRFEDASLWLLFWRHNNDRTSTIAVIVEVLRVTGPWWCRCSSAYRGAESEHPWCL